MKWKLTSRPTYQWDQIEQLLSEGWEPFAVTPETADQYEQVWCRKQVEREGVPA